MYCSRFSTYLSVKICVLRQEKAKKQSESANFCESLIFCVGCSQGLSVKNKNSKKLELDIISLKKRVENQYKEPKTKKLKLKKKETKKTKLKRRII